MNSLFLWIVILISTFIASVWMLPIEQVYLKILTSFIIALVTTFVAMLVYVYWGGNDNLAATARDRQKLLERR